MPIRPENRNRYPADWSQIRTLLLARANSCCEWCGAPHGMDIFRAVADPGRWLSAEFLLSGEHDVDLDEYADRPVRVVLTVAHLCDPIEDCRLANLALLCQRCHNRFDAPARSHNAAATRLRKRNGGGPGLFDQEK